ncbi:hypothetical protein THRCLA_01175 [Thraustotheca clavata]|uniref:Uncharacterized protein n=1 Tax=Thraustotheca clavata TaxID=74557 RepID=A0A1W0A9A3_9STRA|nr:hypothetical protein THRCLA_01175 [Thraustotheca clavata]
MEVQRQEILEELMTLQHRTFQDLLMEHFKLMEAHIDVFGRHPLTKQPTKSVNKTAYEEKLVLGPNDNQFSAVVLDFCDDLVADDSTCTPTNFIQLMQMTGQNHTSFLPGDKMRICFIIEKSLESRNIGAVQRKQLYDAYQANVSVFVLWCQAPPNEVVSPNAPETVCVTIALQLLYTLPPTLPDHIPYVVQKLKSYIKEYKTQNLRILGNRTLKKIQPDAV